MFNNSCGTPYGGAFGASTTFGQQNVGIRGSFQMPAFETTANTGGLWGSVQNKPGGVLNSSTSFGIGAAGGTSSSQFGNTGTRPSGGHCFQPNNAFNPIQPTSFGSGPCGSRNFFQPVMPSAMAGVGIGASSGVSSSQLGNAGTGAARGPFFQPNNAFSANKPMSFQSGPCRSSNFFQPVMPSAMAGVGIGASGGVFSSQLGNAGTGAAGGPFSEPGNALNSIKPTSFGSGHFGSFLQPFTPSTSASFGIGTAGEAFSSQFGNKGTGAAGGPCSQPNNAFNPIQPTLFCRHCGSSTFSKTVLPSTTAGIGFGASGSNFGNTGTGAAGVPYSQPNNAFSANKPVTSGYFGSCTSSGATPLFGTINTTSNLFGATRPPFGGSGFSSAQQPYTTNEDHMAGPSNPTAVGTSSLLGAPNTILTLGQNQNTFEAAAHGGFYTNSGSLFGANQPSNGSLFNPCGQTPTTSMGLWGNIAATQATGPFGAAQTAGQFGAASGLLGQINPGFENVGTQQNLVGNNTVGASPFGTAPFGNHPAMTLGTANTKSPFGFGANLAAGSLITPDGLGTGLGSTLGTMGTYGFNTGTSNLGLGAPQQSVALSDITAAEQEALRKLQLHRLFYNPNKDPLFRNPLPDPQKEHLKPTCLTAQKALATPTCYKPMEQRTSVMRCKTLPYYSASRARLLNGFDDDEPSLNTVNFRPRKNFKMLQLKKVRSSHISSNLRKDDNFQSNRQREEAELQSQEVSQFYVNPISKPLQNRAPPSPLETNKEIDLHMEVSNEDVSLAKREESVHEEVSNEDVSLAKREESVHEEQQRPHPAGGLSGSSTFSQPITPSTSAGFDLGTSGGASGAASLETREQEQLEDPALRPIMQSAPASPHPLEVINL